MAPLLLLPGLVGACVLLLVAGAGHLRRPGELARLVAAHRVLPVAAAAPIARVLPPLELVLGASGLAGVAATATRAPAAPALLPAVAGTTCALMVVLACYRVVQRRVTPEQACGCFGDARAGTPARLVGHLLLTAWTAAPLAAVPHLAPGQAPPWPPGPVLLAGVLGAALALGVLSAGQGRVTENAASSGARRHSSAEEQRVASPRTR